MDLLEDFLSESSAVKAPAASRFKPKAKPRAKKGQSTAAKFVEETAPTEAPSAPVVSDTQSEKENPNIPDVSLTSSSLFTCASPTFPDHFTLSANHASSDLQIDAEAFEARSSSCLDTVEMMSFGANVSGNRTAQSKPKAKGQDGAHDLVEDIADPSNDPLSSSEIEQVARDVPKHAEELDLVSNPSHERPDGEFSLNAVTDESEDVFSGEMDLCMVSDILDQGEEHDKRKTIDTPHSSDNEPDEGPVSSGIEANIGESGFSVGIDEVPHENSKSPTNANNDSVEEENIKKKRGRRSKQAASENDKPARTRKKALKEMDQSKDKPPKKFPRTTTRRKRCVDKSLLEAPEDSLDLQKLPIKDLILLAEHKERIAKKQVAPVQPTSTKERIDPLQPEDSPYDDAEPFGFEHDRDSIDEPSTSGIQTDTGYFNYHTHMQKRSRAKWSKKDTELFYQGIRQFGSDLSMIEQLFPGRTRAQMKLKFKKEERRNPMMIQDAMANKAKDFSHFQLVIERLQEAAAERRQASSEDDDESHPMVEDGKLEENLETDATSQEAAKSEQNSQDDTKELHGPKDESLPEFYDEEEDFDYPGLL